MSSEIGGEYARVTLEWVGDPSDEPYTFDIKLDLATRQVLGQWVCFGLCGDLNKKDEWYPVALRADGILDWGANAESFRFWRTNMREKRIVKGELVTIWDSDDEEHTYRIKQVALLGIRVLDP